MDIIIKKMETDDEKRGKAYVHWKSWQEAYPGIVSQEFLDNLSIEQCEKWAFDYPDNTLVAKEGEKVVGFVAYGNNRWEDELEDSGEIYAIYILSDYYGTGVGEKLMQAGLDEIPECKKVAVRVLKENARAIKFYEKFGFQFDGAEYDDDTLQAKEIRMVMNKTISSSFML